MVNRDVTILPEERWPSAGKRPESAEPAIDEWRFKDWAVGVVVEVNTYIDAGDPAEHRRRGQDESCARPGASNADQTGVLIEPEGGSIGGDAENMKDDAVPILRIGQNAPAFSGGRCTPMILLHSSLKAIATVTIVIERLTQGPHSIDPAMMARAKRGKKDRPNTSPVSERNVREGFMIDTHRSL